MKKNWLAIIIPLSILIFIYGLLSLYFLLKDPPIWPDEAIYADIANNFVNHHQLGSNLWRGLIPNVENHAYLYPPFFFLILALNIKLLGVSIFSQRLLSVVFGLGFLIIYYFFAKLFIKTKNKLFYFLPVALTALDINFLRGTRISRPEIFVLFFGIASLYLFSLNEKRKFAGRKKTIILAASGFLSGLSFLSHYIGGLYFVVLVIYLFLKQKLKVLLDKNFYILSAGFLIPIVVWLSCTFSNINILAEQFLLSLQIKKITFLWPLQAIRSKDASGCLWVGYALLTMAFLTLLFSKRDRLVQFLVLILLASWSFSVIGKLFWYFIIPIPFVYLAASVILTRQSTNKFTFNLTLGILFGLFIFNLAIQKQLYLYYQHIGYDYNSSAKQLLAIIPKGKTIFLSVIPDPYYAFQEDGSYKLFEFPAIGTTPERYLSVLNQTDYVIYNGSYEVSFCGKLLLQYLEKNQQQTFPVNDPYKKITKVIQLKPLSERTNPLANP